MDNKQTLNLDKIFQWFKEGEKKRDEWLIGTEHEKFLFKKNDFKRLGYEDLNGIKTILNKIADEAVGHGLEGDFNRKGTSLYSNKIGERVASKGVNVFDDGTIINRRGSLTIDDEGVPSQKNLLIEDGILVKYMQDTQNAYLMNVEPTGNGRRQSFAHCPMPRMTNTYLDNGSFSSKEIIESVDKGIYAVNFGGGQVDITSGDFVFSSSEAYMIENGKIKYPIKGATLIGNGANAMHKIKMIGNDLKLDEGIGTCGKDGQGVPVGVGQPTLLMDGITIGGTNI